MDPDIRWKQRHQNFDRAFALLQSALSDGPVALSRLEAEGVIQRFEYTFELAWETLKDYMDYGGIQLPIVTPRTVLRAALNSGMLHHGDAWLEMLSHRNLMSHTYDEAHFQAAFRAIAERYLPVMEELHRTLAREFDQEAEDS